MVIDVIIPPQNARLSAEGVNRFRALARIAHNSELWVPIMPIEAIGRGVAIRMFDKEMRPRVSVVVGVLALSLAWLPLVVWASVEDNTLRLPGSGVGLINHYGFQVSFGAAPLVLLTTYLALSYFLRIFQNIDELLTPAADISVVRGIVSAQVDSLFLRSKWRNMLWLFMFIGAASSIAIFSRLKAPVAYWGNDVFNATNYRYGFIVANAFFFWLWSVVYPLGFFYALHLTLSSSVIVAKLKNRNLLRLDFLDPDKCGGMSKFGTLNLLVMLIYAWPSLAAYAFHFTHQSQYLSLIIGACLVSVLLIGQSIYGIYWVAQTIRSERDAAVVDLNKRIVQAMNGAKKNFVAATAALQYRERVLSVASFPYSASVSIVVNVLRFAPTALSIAKVFADRHLMPI
jgi:hypothetical protein